MKVLAFAFLAGLCSPALACAACPLTTTTQNTMAIQSPCTSEIVAANQVTSPALKYVGLTDANALVPAAKNLIQVQAPGMVNVEVWGHGRMVLRLINDGLGTFSGTLDQSQDLRAPVSLGIFAWNSPAGDNSYTVNLGARLTELVNSSVWGNEGKVVPPEAAGMSIKWIENFHAPLSATPCKPKTGVWPACTAPTAADGFTWYENKPGGGDFGDAAFEHTDSVYNPYSILLDSFLRIRSTYDPAYVDPYGFNRHWRSGLLATAFPDGSTNFPAMGNGYYESRIMIPTADASWNTGASGGTWPAFWTLDREAITNTSIGNIEDDIGEWYGVDGTIWHSNVHSYAPATGPNTAIFSGSPTNPAGVDLSWDFHRYGLLVTDTMVSAYFDDVLKGTVAKSQLPSGHVWSPFLMVNLAMGSGWPDNPPPAGYYDMWVDYVRVLAP